LIEGVHAIHQYQFTKTGSIGGVHVPDYNNVYVYTKKKSGLSDADFQKKIVEQAYKDFAEGKFQNQSADFNKLMKEYTQEVSPDREGIISEGLTAISKGKGEQRAIDFIATLMQGKVVYQKDVVGNVGYTEFYDSNGELVATYGNRGWTMYTTKAEAARQTDMCFMYTKAWNDAKAGVPLNVGPTVEVSVADNNEGINDCVTYSKEDFMPENRDDLLSKMLKSMSKVEGLSKIRKLENEVDASEIYATTISNGKITITGSERYQYKAKAYEKLVNASMSRIWSRMPNMSLVGETDVLDQASGLLKYYMTIDNDIRKADRNDSIVNHVEDAFTKWQSEFMPQRYHFEGRA